MSERTLLVDATVFITLAKVDALDCLAPLEGALVVPSAVRREISSEPAQTQLERLVAAGTISDIDWFQWTQKREVSGERVAAATHLGTDPAATVDTIDGQQVLTDGDVALLSLARSMENVVVLSDDKPLRNACKSHSISVSGTIAVLVRAVERGQYTREKATKKLYAMDEVGTRLSASLVKRAEQLIDDASD
jgi:predicted nucleic acid-binding protein